ncbi:D-alanyl-D-alanine carboxypeptidase family protein [Sporosarcina thermotolerans]|uniref:D-alanyl-D-alanine carboxypeptidase family protein n=1 Tax=Sporosarcina thermotolerans TaxID=633404 RepID=A0AAW9A793_9BACL|nr:D-alanyl-D-alanine carboxypeptidase family protein [Sporosarcina thermotolerans]MDW0115603.1 D-alanyl-D-alanine carboxypeptidase family protein [Sporosarcina thermotolerans]
MKRTIIAIVLFVSLVLTPLPNDRKDAAFGGSAWAVIDADTGRLLNGSNENLQLPIASLTKIWTALTFLESGSAGEKITISPAAASAEGSSIYTQQGEIMDSDALLYGLMLRSGNDAAFALAEHAGGSVDGFVDLMNEKAKLYGFERTTFKNPSGLHHEEHLSTAYETGLMLYFAMKNNEFRKIASTENFVYRKGDEVRSWRNKHRLVHTNKTVIAGKTGFTKAAGRTLATYFEKDGKKLIVVTLNNGNDWNIHEQLASETFNTYDLVTVAKKGEYRILPGITGKLKKPIVLLLNKDEAERVSHVVYIPRNQGKKGTGTWTVSLDNELLITTQVDIRK